MDQLKTSFFKYIRSAKIDKPTDILSLYNRWILNVGIPKHAVLPLWKSICTDINQSLRRNKISDTVSVEITGDPETITEMLSGEIDEEKDLNLLENEKKKLESGKPKSEEKRTLFDSLAEESTGEEEEAELEENAVPPLAGEGELPEEPAATTGNAALPPPPPPLPM